jgi:hypothetical protein
MRYIGIVKTVTKNYLMNHLSKVELACKGDRAGLIAMNEGKKKPELLAFVWRD